MVHPADVDPRLTAHLRDWLGAWPPAGGFQVVGSERRVEPGWNGQVRAVNGVATPQGTVLSVPPDAVDEVAAAGDDLATVAEQLAHILGRPGAVFGSGIFRWSTDPTPGDDPGAWLPTDDPRVPEWLHPFNGDVLVAFEAGDHGPEVAAGVGRKQHDRYGHEIAVVTEEGFRGRGYARELVTQAARRILDDGAVPVYLHAPDNLASARTADAAGFPDRGWRIVGLFDAEAEGSEDPAADPAEAGT